MKKYKLIKWYPGLPESFKRGKVIAEVHEKGFESVTLNGIPSGIKTIESHFSNVEFWQPVEILLDCLGNELTGPKVYVVEVKEQSLSIYNIEDVIQVGGLFKDFLKLFNNEGVAKAYLRLLSLNSEQREKLLKLEY